MRFIDIENHTNYYFSTAQFIHKTTMDYVTTFAKSVTETSEKMIKNCLPRKLAEIDTALQQTTFNLKRLGDVRRCSWASMGIDNQQNIEAQVMKKANAGAVDKKKIKTIESNKVICEGMNKLSSEVIEVLEMCNTLRMWVTLLIPKIEDGSNFGRSVLEEAVNEIQEAECQATSYLSLISSYFNNRAKIASKVVQYPHIIDFYRYVVEEDEKQFVGVRLMVMDIRNNYSSIQDLIAKNMENIKNPATSSCANQY